MEEFQLFCPCFFNYLCQRLFARGGSGPATKYAQSGSNPSPLDKMRTKRGQNEDNLRTIPSPLDKMATRCGRSRHTLGQSRHLAPIRAVTMRAGWLKVRTLQRAGWCKERSLLIPAGPYSHLRRSTLEKDLRRIRPVMPVHSRCRLKTSGGGVFRIPAKSCSW